MDSEPREVARPRGGRVERFLDSLFPGRAVRRIETSLRLRRARLAERYFSKIEREAAQFTANRFEGATTKRGFTQWAPGAGSADEDLLDDLDKLRQRSRDLCRNDTHASGILDTWANNIVGTGLRPQSRINRDALKLSESEADKYQRAAEAIFSKWWKVADAAEILSFGELQDLAIRGIFESGDVGILPRPVPDGLPALRLQVLEADRIATPLSKQGDPYHREGIEIDDRGRHLAVWVKKTHPGDELGRLKTDDFLRIPTRDPETGRPNIWHLYRLRRPDQSRGYPMLAPSMLLFHDLHQYFQAEVMAAKIAACFALFVTTPDPAAVMMAGAALKESDGRYVEHLEPGLVKYLDPGQRIESANPGRPNVNFDPFTIRILRAIGSGIQMPYEVVSSDFSQTTYTSGRMALTSARFMFLGWRSWLIEKFLQPVYAQVLEEAFLADELPAGRDFYAQFDEWTAARWVGPAWSWVDPEKEVNATVMAMANHLTTLADEAAGRGVDWEDLLEQKAREKRKITALGLDPPVPEPLASGPPGAPAGAPAGKRPARKPPARKTPPKKGSTDDAE